MEFGDLVICTKADGYRLTVGKQYIVIRYAGDYVTKGGILLSAVITLQDDHGIRIRVAADRFMFAESAA